MHLEDLTIHSKLFDYRVSFPNEDNFLSQFTLDQNSFFVVDAAVWNLYKHNLLRPLEEVQQKAIVVMDEDMKNLDSVTKLYDHIMQYSPKKNMTLISIGGGITQDVTGFMASTLYRGIRWVFVPTTVLAQADSCIGSKTSLNYNKYKNLIGTFFPPRHVIIQPKFVETLNTLDYYSGLGEIAKLHILGGRAHMARLAEALVAVQNRERGPLMEAVHRSLLIKQEYIESDEFDTGKRNLLNYGHCFGHAIESATNFSIPHGQAVVLGMILANRVAETRQYITKAQRVEREQSFLVPLIKFDWAVFQTVNPIEIIEGMTKDKKRTGEGLALILPRQDGFIQVNDLSREEAHQTLMQCQQRWKLPSVVF